MHDGNPRIGYVVLQGGPCHSAAGAAIGASAGKMEATAGIEPACTALQAAASPLRHVASSTPHRGGDILARSCAPVKRVSGKGCEVPQRVVIPPYRARRRHNRSWIFPPPDSTWPTARCAQ